MKMKTAMQNCDGLVVVMMMTAATHTTGEGDNPYRETVALAYNVKGDNLECAIVCQGNGSADSRILADHDDDETIDPDVLREGAAQIAKLYDDHPDKDDVLDIVEYINAQADYIESREAAE